MTQNPPTFRGKVRSFASAMWLSVKLIVSREPVLVSEEVKAARLRRCAVCEHRVGEKFSTCEICGCLIEAKAMLRKPGCPLGYWATV